ncbi:MAG: response regulator [Sulfuricurvum sp.]|uniref:response regulator n=1 Tax=Sulfuricurvum sp. TaxID=2025608 RepID=UPI002629B384|nr:response regulator [Sulfuricurvum sp.]MDD2838002.1 response regulator [Sulfuricurvum sp.]MDD4884216.1 response regulator [Sulfuricurvum sp.]
MHILIAEDEEYNQMVIQAMIEMLYPQVRIEMVSDGREAFEKLQGGSFDLVLTDIDMPVMNGYDLLTEVRKRGLNIPMICVTAFAISGDKEKLLLHGFERYISKPIDMEDLKSVLDPYLEGEL